MCPFACFHVIAYFLADSPRLMHRRFQVAPQPLHIFITASLILMTESEIGGLSTQALFVAGFQGGSAWASRYKLSASEADAKCALGQGLPINQRVPCFRTSVKIRWQG